MGLPKTGTTSFQESCKANSQRLEEQGYLYLYIAKPENASMEVFFKEFVEKVFQSLSSDKNIILSAEALSNLNVHALEKIKNLFLAHNFEIIALLGIRSPYALLCSAKAQGIRAGQYRAIDFFPSIIDRIKNIQEVFENKEFYSYKEMCEHKDGLVAFLFEKMQIEYKDFEIIRTNTRYSNTIMRIQNRLNLTKPALINNAVNPEFISVKDLESDVFDRKYLLTEEEFSLVNEAFEKERKFLEENLGKEFIDEKIEFAENDPIAELCIAIIEGMEKNKTC